MTRVSSGARRSLPTNEGTSEVKTDSQGKRSGRAAGELISPAIIAALITAVIGPIAVIIVTHLLEPGTIRKTKESISTITISDEELRTLGGSIVYVESLTGRGATGFLFSQRFIATTSHLAGTLGANVNVTRRKGQFDQHRDTGRVAAVDTTNRIAIVDMGKQLRDAPLPRIQREELHIFDKVFALVYAGANYVSVREGRVLSLDSDRDGGRRVIVIDMPISPGMAGSPVFDKNGQVVGMITGSQLDSQVTFITSVRQIEYSCEGLGG
jgi:S1-C subfamily serine protease